MDHTLYQLVSKNQRQDTWHISEEIIRYGSRDQKIVALTFDDGPHPRITPEILDVLKKYDVKATFFMLGRNVENYPEVAKRVYDEGHEIGNHTYSHIDVKASSEAKIAKEIEKTQEIIEETIGVRCNIFRPPYGYCTEKVCRIAKDEGCKTILWSPNLDSKDWANPGAKKIVKVVLEKTKNGQIILLHDYVPGESQTAKALEEIIKGLKDKGYEFMTVSDMIDSLSTDT